MAFVGLEWAGPNSEIITNDIYQKSMLQIILDDLYVQCQALLMIYLSSIC